MRQYKKSNSPTQKSFADKAVFSCLVFIVALWIMAEEWIWDSIESLMRRLSRLPFVARIEARITNLNPYVAFGLFFVPMLMLLPMKLYAAYLIGSGEVVRGLTFIIIAKVVTTAVITKLFLLCKPQLMTIRFFERLYVWSMSTKDYLYERLEQIAAWRLAKERVRAIKAWLKQVKAKYSGENSFFRRLRVLKKQMKKKPGDKNGPPVSS